jgi:uncharacterized protein YndB with AHSA1/START domain
MAFQPERGVIRWKLHFASPRERVFAALATDGGRASFWAEAAEEREGTITFCFSGHPPHSGRVLRAEAPRVFAVEYFGAETVFTLEDDGAGGTDLSLVVAGADEEERNEVIAGWVSVLMAMKAAVDHGVDLRNHDPQRSWAQGYADN